MEKVRLGLIGLGNIGTSHSRFLRNGDIQRCELVAACDIVPEKLKPFADLKTYTDSRDLIRSGEVDAVLIGTPHYDHTTIGIDALDNGLHVLVEKPISVHKAECERLIAAHARNPRQRFAAMFQMRTEPIYQRVKKLIDDGELGDIRRVNWIMTCWYRTEAYYASGGWRATWKGEGGGVLLNQCPHNLDLFQWFFGMPSNVRAFCHFGKFHDIETEDEVTAYFEFPNGATGVFVTTTGEAPGTDRLEIAGDRGRLVVETGKLRFDRTEVSVSDHLKTCENGFTPPDLWHCDIPYTDTPNKGHAAIVQNFIDAILDGAPLIAPAEEGLRSVELANAMIYSTLTNDTVQFPLDGATYESCLKQRIANSRFEKKVSERTASPDDFAQSDSAARARG
ncbi:MAG: Gfo/Idh/MocA family oxidoreductase [FCB group bacterium]|jgi:predicted dehydrogenase|nr:Gfo/Idh/MocA family oxidoreductase [FCB group bacterium]